MKSSQEHSRACKCFMAVWEVDAVGTSGSVHRYIAGPFFADTELMLCSAAFACREEQRTSALSLEFPRSTMLI